MKFTSIILVTLATFGFVSAASQTAPSIPPAGEAVTPALNTAPKSNVQAKTFGLIAFTLKSAFNLLFGGFGGKPYGHGGYYNGYPYYSGILGWNGYNQYYGTVNNCYTIYSPNIKYFNNGDGTYTLYIYNINGVQGATAIQITCPVNAFKINRSSNGYLCQINQNASCSVRYA